jgi:hypothetical protein
VAASLPRFVSRTSSLTVGAITDVLGWDKSVGLERATSW